MDTLIYYLIQLLKAVIKPFRKESYTSNDIKIEFLKLNIPKVSYSVEKAVEIAQENARTLISPLGEFHWRGLNNPDKLYAGSGGQFHANEQGDATLHTGSYLASLSWKYRATNDNETLSDIRKLLEYFELHIKLNKGGLGRNFVKNEFYLKFPREEQNGMSKSYNLFNEAEASKFSMRYRPFKWNDEVYWQRYDVSVDAISHAIFGLFMVFLFVPTFREKAGLIILSQYYYYQKTNWKIIDDEGNRVRYGDHSPGINFFSRVNEIIFQFVETGKLNLTFKDKMIINGVPSYLSGLRINYFNSFINICQLLSLHLIGMDVSKGIKRLRVEMMDFNDNWLMNSVYNYITKEKNKNIRELDEWSLNIGHPKGTIPSSYIVPQHLRCGYSKYEFAPNLSLMHKEGSELTGNHDLLLAYWIH